MGQQDQQNNPTEQNEARGSSLHMSLGCGGPRNVGQKRCVFTLGGKSHVFFFGSFNTSFSFFLGGGWVKEQSWTLHDFVKWNCAYFLFLGGWFWGWECEQHAIYIHTPYVCISILYICLFLIVSL